MKHGRCWLMFESSGEGLVREVTSVDFGRVEVNELRVISARVNELRTGILPASAQHGGTVALKLLAKERLFENSIRLGFNTEVIDFPVVGNSAQLLFALAAFVHVASEWGYGETSRSYCFAATGVIDHRGNVSQINGLAEKIQACLDCEDLPHGSMIFYPKQNEGDIDSDLLRRSVERGMELYSVERVDEALNRLGFNLKGWWEGSPYMGLLSFGVRERPIFFGRKDETKMLIEQLESRALDGRPGVIVIASSGAGKSSFIAAGVIATIEAKTKNVKVEYAIWRPADAKSGGDAAQIDEATLARSIYANWAKPSDGFKGIAEKTVPETLDALALSLSDTSLQGRRLIWAVDQFEEVFTQPFTESTTVALAKFLRQLQSIGVWVIAAMRSEFYGQYQSLVDECGSPLLLDTFGSKGEFPLLKMNTTSFHEVVAGPARLADLAFETRGDDKISLLQQILTDAYRVQDVLPLLGFAMQKLYEGVELAPVQDEENVDGDSGDLQRQLRFKTYEANGKLAGAIRVVADERFTKLDADAQGALSSVLDALAVPSDSEDFEFATSAELNTWPTGSAGRKLIDALLGIRVLVSVDDNDGKPTLIRVAHESLFRNWPVAAEALKRSRDVRLTADRLRVLAAEWERRSRPHELLVRSDHQLAEMSNWLKAQRGSSLLVEFIEASKKFRRRRSNIAWALLLLGLVSLSALLVFLRNAELRSADSEKQKAELAAEVVIASRRDVGLNFQEAARQIRDDGSDFNQDLKLQLLVAAQHMLPSHVVEGDLIDTMVPSMRLEKLRQVPSDILFFSASPDGAEGVSTHQDGLIRRWQLPTLRQIGTPLTLSGERPLTVTYSPVGRSLLVESGTGKFILLDGDKFESRTQPFSFGSRLVSKSEFSADGNHLLFVFTDGVIESWDVGKVSLSGSRRVTQSGSITSTAFSPDRKTIALAHTSGDVLLVDADTLSPIRRLPKVSEEPVYALSFSSDASRLAISGQDRTIRVYSVASAKQIYASNKGHDDTIYSLLYSAKDERLVAVGGDGKVTLRTLTPHGLIEPLYRLKLGKIRSIATLGIGSRLVTTTTDRTLRVWNLNSLGKHPSTYFSADIPARAIAFSPDKNLLGIGDDLGTLRVLASDDFSQLSLISDAHPGGISALSFSPDSKFLVTLGMDGKAKVWKSTSGTGIALVETIEVPSAGHSLSFSGDVTLGSANGKTFLAVTFGDNNFYVRPVSPGQRWRAFRGHKGPVTGIRFIANGERIASVSLDKTLRLWDVESGTQIGRPAEHPEQLTAIAFNNASGLVATGSASGIVRIWSAQTLVQSGSALHHSSDIKSISFSGDGAQLAAAEFDGGITLWKLDLEPRIRKAIRGHNGPVYSLAHSPDSTFVLSGASDGLQKWPALGQWHIAACKLLAHSLDPQQWRRYAKDYPYQQVCADMPVQTF
jgi:WD40 repeat protein